MKKGGFTLIEVLVFIVLLGVITLVTIPLITSNINSNKSASFKTTENILTNAADLYVSVNIDSMDLADGQTFISLADLKPYVKEVKGPSGEACTGGVVVLKESEANYTYHAALDCGKYKSEFAVDIAPEIVLTLDNELYRNSHTIDFVIVDDKDEIASLDYQWTTTSYNPTSGWQTLSGSSITKSDGEEKYYLFIKAVDVSDNASIESVSALFDNTAPVITLDNVEDGEDTNVNIEVSDTHLASKFYMWTNTEDDPAVGSGSWASLTQTQLTAPTSIGSTVYLHIKAIDEANNITFGTSDVIIFDADAPAVTLTKTTSGTQKSHSVDVTITEINPDIEEYVWSTSASTPSSGWTDLGSATTLTKNTDNGTWYLYVRAIDLSSNETVESVSVVLDNTVPTLTLTSSDTTPTKGPVTIKIDYGDSHSSVTSVVTPKRTITLPNSSFLDYTTWVVGTEGSQIGFYKTGLDSESEIVNHNNPWGFSDATWASLDNDSTSDSDGGWNSSKFNIDNTKTYRFSVWMRRENVGNGRSYFGTYGYEGSNNTGVKDVYDNLSTNPYFGYGLITEWSRLEDEWLLLIAYIHENTYSGATETTTGIYDLDGNKLYTLKDFKWLSTTESALHRTFLYSSTSITEDQYWYRPRVDLVDGSEPTISEMLKGEEPSDDDVYMEITTNGTYNFTAYDEAGNFVNNSITVSNIDNTVPVITLVGSATMELDVGDSYTDPGYSATDNLDGTITGSVVVGGDTVDTSTAGTYVVTYNVTDAAGNVAVQKTRTVEVVVTYAYYKTITIDADDIDSTLTNFPMRVLLNSSNFNFANSLSTGEDITFKDNSDTLLDFEMVYFDATNHLAEYYVKVPSISSSTDTSFKMYYGKSGETSLENVSNVWTNDFEIVVHMGVATLYDSTGNYSLTTHGTTLQVDSTYGKKRDFNGTTEYITAPLTLSNILPSFTVSIFAEKDTTGDRRVLAHMGNGAANGWAGDDEWQVGYDSDVFNPGIYDDSLSHKQEAVMNSVGTSEMYLVSLFKNIDNGNSSPNVIGGMGNATWGLNTSSDDIAGAIYTDDVLNMLYIGNTDSNTRLFDGQLYDFRIASVERTEAWAKAEWKSLYSNSDIVAVGSQVNLGPGPFDDWQYYKTFTIDSTKIDGNLTNFPITVILDSGNFNFAHARSDGYDIGFTDSDGNEIAFEREEHDSSNQRATYHVKIPSVSSSSSTTFKMYYGKSDAINREDITSVWDSNYVFVNHLNDSLLDSTSNNNDGTNYGSTVVNGMTGKARNFNGSQRILVPQDNSLAPTAALTYICLFKPTQNQAQYAKPIWYGQNSSSPWGPYGIQMNNADNYPRVTTDGVANNIGPITISLNNYHLFSAKYDGSHFTVFYDLDTSTTEAQTGTIDNYDTSNGLGIGDKYQTGQEFVGEIDEIRISNIARSDDWLNAEHESLFDNLITYGAEQSN